MTLETILILILLALLAAIFFLEKAARELATIRRLIAKELLRRNYPDE
jgi:hypothetical protein